MKYGENELALIALASVPGLGVRRISALLSVAQEPCEVFDLHDDTVCAIAGDKLLAPFRAASSRAYAEDVAARLEAASVRPICRFTCEYPDLLENIFDPPYVLFVRGTLPLPAGKLLAVVGSRNASRYGLESAYSLSRELAGQGVVIVSGMARGVDSASHRGALAGGGRTAAVLGCGLDVCYPPENVELFEQIAQRGVLISEYMPGTAPLPAHFRQRNRIIAGLCPALLLVEARESSGAMITVDYATDFSREVFAVPGQINSPLSYNPNRLIRSGAGMVLEAADILEPMGWSADARAAKGRKTPPPDLSAEERLVVEPLLAEELSYDELSAKTGLSADRLNSLLTMLSLRGIIKQHPGKVFSI